MEGLRAEVDAALARISALEASAAQAQRLQQALHRQVDQLQANLARLPAWADTDAPATPPMAMRGRHHQGNIPGFIDADAEDDGSDAEVPGNMPWNHGQALAEEEGQAATGLEDGSDAAPPTGSSPPCGTGCGLGEKTAPLSGDTRKGENERGGSLWASEGEDTGGDQVAHLNSPSACAASDETAFTRPPAWEQQSEVMGPTSSTTPVDTSTVDGSGHSGSSQAAGFEDWETPASDMLGAAEAAVAEEEEAAAAAAAAGAAAAAAAAASVSDADGAAAQESSRAERTDGLEDQQDIEAGRLAAGVSREQMAASTAEDSSASSMNTQGATVEGELRGEVAELKRLLREAMAQQASAAKRAAAAERELRARKHQAQEAEGASAAQRQQLQQQAAREANLRAEVTALQHQLDSAHEDKLVTLLNASQVAADLDKRLHHTAAAHQEAVRRAEAATAAEHALRGEVEVTWRRRVVDLERRLGQAQAAAAVAAASSPSGGVLHRQASATAPQSALGSAPWQGQPGSPQPSPSCAGPGQAPLGQRTSASFSWQSFLGAQDSAGQPPVAELKRQLQAAGLKQAAAVQQAREAERRYREEQVQRTKAEGSCGEWRAKTSDLTRQLHEQTQAHLQQSSGLQRQVTDLQRQVKLLKDQRSSADHEWQRRLADMQRQLRDNASMACHRSRETIDVGSIRELIVAELARAEDRQALTQRYRELAALWHPDKQPLLQELAHRLTQILNEARDARLQTLP